MFQLLCTEIQPLHTLELEEARQHLPLLDLGLRENSVKLKRMFKTPRFV